MCSISGCNNGEYRKKSICRKHFEEQKESINNNIQKNIMGVNIADNKIMSPSIDIIQTETDITIEDTFVSKSKVISEILSDKDTVDVYISINKNLELINNYISDKNIKTSYKLIDKTTSEYVHSDNDLVFIIRIAFESEKYPFNFFWIYNTDIGKDFINYAHSLFLECHEVLFNNYCNFFMDIDMQLSMDEYEALLNSERNEGNEDNLIGEIVDAYELATKKSFDEHKIKIINNVEFYITTRNRKNEQGYKISIHLISNYWMEISQAKALAKDIKKQIDYIETNLSKALLKLVIDVQPYHLRGSLALANGYKNGHKNIVYMKPEQIHGFITIFNQDCDIIINFAKYCNKDIRSFEHSGIVSKELIDEAMKHIERIYAHYSYDFENFTTFGIGNNCRRIKRLRSCFCECCEDTHDNDNSLIIIFNEQKGLAFHKCAKMSKDKKAIVFYSRDEALGIVPRGEINIQHKFDDTDNFYFKDFENYLALRTFDCTKDPSVLYNYLKENLPRVCCWVLDNVILKMSKDTYFHIKKFHEFSIVILKYSYINHEDKLKVVKEPLWQFIKKNFVHFHRFTEVLCNYDFANTDNDKFIMSRDFVAKKNDDYQSNPKLQMFLNFVKQDLFSDNQKMYDFEMDKLSVMLRYPHKKTGIITLLFGQQGTGKNTYTDFLCNFIFGRNNCLSNVAGIKGIVKDFNGDVCGKKLIIINELPSTQVEFRAAFDALKGIITEETQTIRLMYTNPMTVLQSTEYYALSNHIGSYVIEGASSRREFVPDISTKNANNKKYWGPLRKAINNQECGDCFYSYLMDRTITYDEFTSKKIPESKTRNAIIENCKSDVELFVDKVLAELTEAREVQATAFHQEYLVYHDLNKCKSHPGSRTFWHKLTIHYAERVPKKETKKGKFYTLTPNPE